MKKLMFIYFIGLMFCISCSNTYENEEVTQTLTIVNKIPYNVEYSIIKGNVTVSNSGNYDFQEAEYYKDVNNRILKKQTILANDKVSIYCNKENVNITILFWIMNPRDSNYGGMKNINFSGNKTVTYNLGNIN